MFKRHIPVPVNQFIPLRHFHVLPHHLAHQFLKRGAGSPPQLGAGFTGITQQRIHFGRAKVTGINPDDDLTNLEWNLPCTLGNNANFINPLSFPA